MSRLGKEIPKRKKYTNWNENLIDQLDSKAEMAAERWSELEDTLQEIIQNIAYKINEKYENWSNDKVLPMSIKSSKWKKKKELEANK